MKSFLIQKGKHRSYFSWRPFLKDVRTYTFYFNESARYKSEPENLWAINKLVGFSDGALNHHKNSFRIGWRYSPTEDCIELHSYIYKNGEREHKFLTTLNLLTPMTCEVTCMRGVYRILINGHIVKYANRGRVKWRYKHMLYPYFGGKARAPHDILILLNYK